ncbi:hypothetical protein KP509_29G072400 [Ceratopteris richardii]|uniref:Uncharacterized protein n=1 Tax=Ceratopteris richardii TaxID=49495 RepID=A0A8T2R9T9_CERRI|nr:hypothetical protein KP509_29G072400 [Ceratopteris richardii]
MVRLLSSRFLFVAAVVRYWCNFTFLFETVLLAWKDQDRVNVEHVNVAFRRVDTIKAL